jgi:hypothetical protein
VAGEEHEHGVAEEVFLVHPAVRAVVVDHAREPVGGGVLAVALDQPAQVLRHPGECLRAGPHQLFAPLLLEARAQRVDHSVGPHVEAGLVFLRNAEQPADHRDGERVGDVLDQVDPLPTTQIVDQAHHDLLNLGLEPRDQAGLVRRSEVPVCLPAQAIVIGRIRGDEPRWAGCGPMVLAVAGIGAHARVVQQRHDFAIPAHHVGAVGLARDGRLALPGIERVGVVAVRVVEDLRQQGLLGHGFTSSIHLCWACISVGEWPVRITVGRCATADGCGKAAGTGSSARLSGLSPRSGGKGPPASINCS